jgi:hypothetical protein
MNNDSWNLELLASVYGTQKRLQFRCGPICTDYPMVVLLLLDIWGESHPRDASTRMEGDKRQPNS